MAIQRTRSKRKVSGGRYIDNRKGRQYEKVNAPILTKIGETKTRTSRTAGGNSKQSLIQAQTISVADPQKKTITVTKIQSVVENAANRNYVIRNIVNKGAIVQTELGKVKVTSRPGQTATVSGVLVE